MGLDLDHTLAVYEDEAVNSIAFRETCRYLVEIRRYPARLLSVPYDHHAAVRGLVADTRGGRLLKLDHLNRVRRALGAGGFASRNSIAKAYGVRAFSDAGCYEIHSPFDLPAGVLFGSFLEMLSDLESARRRRFMAHIAEMLDHCHRFGSLKQTIAADPARFIRPCPGLDDQIGALRDRGKKTFLLTNSSFRYARDVLDHLFPGDRGRAHWRELFDLIVVDANKPSFFGSGRAPAPHVVDPAVWSSGDARSLERQLGAARQRILYIGDNPVADAAPARARGWRTALVAPEVETDTGPTGGADGDGTEALDGWGSVMWESGEPTRFTGRLRTSADVFAARVEHILACGPCGAFRRE